MPAGNHSMQKMLWKFKSTTRLPFGQAGPQKEFSIAVISALKSINQALKW